MEHRDNYVVFRIDLYNRMNQDLHLTLLFLYKIKILMKYTTIYGKPDQMLYL